jgi:Fanconi-associated nuclease 1
MQKESALKACEEALEDESLPLWGLVLVERHLQRLARPPLRWKPRKLSWSANILEPTVRIIFGRCVGTRSRSKKIQYESYDGSTCSVETLVLHHYKVEEDLWGVHCEGGVFVTLFGLLFWDVIFHPVPEVFQSKYQVGPLDLDTETFYHSRRDLIEKRLNAIRSSDGNNSNFVASYLSEIWAAHHGTSCVGVDWRRPLPFLQSLCRCLGGKVLAEICRCLALDYSGARAGMPDLFLWKESDHNAPPRAKFVEVKSPNDSLSTKQQVWISALLAAGAAVELCHVTHQIDKATHGKSINYGNLKPIQITPPNLSTLQQ